MDKAIISERTITYGNNQFKINCQGWQVLSYGSFGPNDPQVGLKYKWMPIPSDKVPDEVKKVSKK